MYLFSVIVPVYNGENFIGRCIESMQRQNCKDWECIFVDDGSTDDSYEILSNYNKHDCRIKVIHQENRGAALARVSGIKAAHGDFLIFVDIDDTLEPDALTDIADIIDRAPEVDIVVFGMNIIKGRHVRKRRVQVTSNDRVSYLKSVMSGKNGLEMWGKAFKSHLFTPMPEVADNVRIGEDAAFFFQLALRSNCIIYDERAHYNYIQQESSASKVKSNKLAEETMDAAFFIEDKLRQAPCYTQISDYIAPMFLLFFSNSTRRGRLQKNSRYCQKISECISFRALIKLPLYKSVYILLRYLLLITAN